MSTRRSVSNALGESLIDFSGALTPYRMSSEAFWTCTDAVVTCAQCLVGREKGGIGEYGSGIGDGVYLLPTGTLASCSAGMTLSAVTSLALRLPGHVIAFQKLITRFAIV